MSPDPVTAPAPLLAVDAGNSRIKIRVYTEKGGGPVGGLPRPSLDSAEGEAFLEEFLGSPGAPRIAMVSCARPADEETLGALLGHYDVDVHLLHQADPCPVQHRYEEGFPGPDRLAAAIALRHFFPGRPAVSVDFGTATNSVAVDCEGALAGGAILPGVRLQAESLHRATEGRLPVVVLEREAPLDNDFAGGTPGAMVLGILLGHAGAVDTLIAHHRRLLGRGSEAALVATGGNAALVLPHMKERPLLLPHLVLDGLAVWGRPHAKRKSPP